MTTAAGTRPTHALPTGSRATPFLASAAYTALAFVDTRLSASTSSRTRRWRLLTKPLLMPALATAFASSTSSTSLSAPAPRGTAALRTGTFAAQGFSGIGDIALLNKSEPAFLGGLSAFFAAHIGYAAAFGSVGRPLRDQGGRTGVYAAATVLTVAGPVMGWAAGKKSPALRGPVVAYAGILSTMFATSSRLDPALPAGARRLVVAGTALFLTSDSIIGLRNFVLPNPSPASDAAVMATYTAGQGLIAAGVAQAIRAGSGPRR